VFEVTKKNGFILLALVVALGLVVLLYKSPPAEWDKAKQLGEFIDSQGFLGALVFFIVAAIATSVGLPRQFFAFASGFAFGVSMGVLLSSFAALCGCAITFFVSRRWLSGRIKSKYPKVVSGLNNLIREDAFLKILVLRLQPLGTNLLTNLCAGVTVQFVDWLFASNVGVLLVRRRRAYRL